MGRKRKTDGGTATVETNEKKAKRGESPEEIKKILEDVEKAEKEVQRAEIELNSRKEAAKSAKAEWMVAVEDLRRKVRTRERWREELKRQPLLNKKPDKSPLLPKELPDGAKEAKTVGLLADIDCNGESVAKKGDTATAYVDKDGDVFLLHYLTLDGGKKSEVPEHVLLVPEEYAEIVADDKQPLIDAAEKPASAECDAWKVHGLGVLRQRLTEKQFDALEATGVKTLGDLQTKFNAHGGYWPKELGVHGRHKDAIEEAFNSYLISQQ